VPARAAGVSRVPGRRGGKPKVSFANCGLPDVVGGEIGDRDDFLLQTPQTLAATLALDVRTRHEAMRIARTPPGTRRATPWR
jgi:hypothetical protein